MLRSKALGTLCPLLRTDDGVSLNCQAEGCMWWIDDDDGGGECAVSMFAGALLVIAGSVTGDVTDGEGHGRPS